jgi:hypothetical protein
MSKLEGKFSYKSWCILKHGLERSIKCKEESFNLIKGFMTTKQYKNKLNEIKEEKKVLEEVTEMIEQFKLYFKGHGYSEYK